MEDIRNEQIEALETLKEYNVKIVSAIKEVVDEFRGDKKEDTDAYLNKILEGINWEIQVINGTMDLVNEKEELISKESVNNVIVKLNDSIKEKNNALMVDTLEKELFPFLQNLDGIIEKVLV